MYCPMRGRLEKFLGWASTLGGDNFPESWIHCEMEVIKYIK